MRGFLLLGVCLLLGACSGQQLKSPDQPNPNSIQIANQQLSVLVHSDGTPLTGKEVWPIGDYAVRAACHAYLNGAAAKQSDLSLGSAAVGVIGAGVSIANPIAGIAASLIQTLMAAYSTSGPVPTAADAILIQSYLDTYEAGVAAMPQMTPAAAMSMIDDEWFACTAGGIEVLSMKAKITAQLSVIGPTQAAFATRFSSATPSLRPIVIFNGR